MTTTTDVFPDWRQRAACHRAPDPDLWFSDDTARSDKAIGICETCPVLRACAEFAQKVSVSYGVWAGERYHADPPTTMECLWCDAELRLGAAMSSHISRAHSKLSKDHRMIPMAHADSCQLCGCGPTASTHLAMRRDPHPFKGHVNPRKQRRCVVCGRDADNATHRAPA